MDEAMAAAATRFRSIAYTDKGIERFSLFEKTSHGVLITDFDGNGSVLSQIHRKNNDLENGADAYLLGRGVDARYLDYDSLKINAVCVDCGSKNIRRDLDFVEMSKLNDVPVVPLFSCGDCKARLFYMTDEYLAALVKSNPNLFDKSEIEKRDKDWDVFINELRQYIVSIFAMKKIKHLKIGDLDGN